MRPAPASPAHHEVAGRVRRWVAGKPEAETDIVRAPARALLVQVAMGDLQPGGAHDLPARIAVHGALEQCASWHFDSALSQVLVRHGDPWPDLAEAMALRVLAHALAYTRPEALAPHDDAVIGLALCEDLVLGLGHGERILDGYRAHDARPQQHPDGVVQVAHELHAAATRRVEPDEALFAEPLAPAYAALVRSLRGSTTDFAAALDDACELHLERSSGIAGRWFAAQTDALVPSELLAAISVRGRLGLKVPSVVHPLLAPYLADPARSPQALRSALLDQLEWRLNSSWL